MSRTIRTDDAPAAVGAYSQGKTDSRLAFTAGQIPATPDGELLDDAPIETQTEQCLENVRGVLQAEELDLEDVLKVTVFLDDMENFDAMNDVYATYFEDEPPARSALEVANLPKGVGIEIEAIASHG